MGGYLIFNVYSIVLFALALVVLILDAIFKKIPFKIAFGLLATGFVVASILIGASYQEILIAVLVLVIIALFTYYPRKKEEKVWRLIHFTSLSSYQSLSSFISSCLISLDGSSY